MDTLLVILAVLGILNLLGAFVYLGLAIEHKLYERKVRIELAEPDPYYTAPTEMIED